MLQASSSTGVVKPSVDSVKNVPTFLPPIIVLMAFSCIPLHITTLTPRSKAQVAALTFESIPPVPTYNDNNVCNQIIKYFPAILFTKLIIVRSRTFTCTYIPYNYHFDGVGRMQARGFSAT
uniref:Uncharacterized protein n=1 Tax=Glossina palpalis gambiensis TaxID=67801 RepID=A0A1B0B8P4_9MUSC